MKQEGFTVIELLVVIALIGLLASIVLVSFNLPEKRYRATVAKSLEFSQSIQNALGIDAAGWWNFDDDIADGYVTDTSGQGNTGKLCDSTGCNGVGPTQTDDTPHKVAGTGGGKFALSFGGSDDYVNVGKPIPSSLRPTNAFSIEAWVKPSAYSNPAGDYIGGIVAGQWDPNVACYSVSIDYRDSAHGGVKGGIHFQIGTGSTWWTTGSQGTTNQALPLNQWTHVAAVAEVNKQYKVYFNGKLLTNWIAGSSIGYTDNCRLAIGWNEHTAGSTRYFNGLIDDVRIYSQALTAQEIHQHYVEGLKTHPQFTQK